MNKTSQNFNQISKVGLMENAKIILKYKFGFIPIQKKESKEKPNNRSFLISKSSINNSKDKTKKVKLKLSFSNNKSNKGYKKKKICQSCTSLIKKNESLIKKSRNYKNNMQNDNKTKNFSTYYSNTKTKILKKEINMHNNSYSIPNDYKKKKKMIKILAYKKISKITPEKKNINNISTIKNRSKFSNDVVLNVKPIIKKKENIINNHLWSKLITTIDQKQNSKIKKLKNKSLSKVNININTNISINIKNNIIDCRKENNDISIDNQNNISYSNLTTNNVNININNSISNKKNNSKNYLPNISLNDITNFNPPEKDYSTISINNDKNSESIKEKKIQLNRIIQERQKEKDKNNMEKSKEKELDIRRNSKNSKISKIISFKNENKIHKISSSSNYEDSRMDVNNTLLYKREIKYCDTDTFKTNSNKSRKKKENDNEEKNNYKKDWKKINDKDINDKSKNNKEKDDFDNSNKNELSFIGENNSIQKIEKQSIGKVSSEQENLNNINNESNFTESNNRNIFTCNNKYYNLCNMPNGSTNISENLKIYRLLSKNYSYNVSSRGIQDETAKLFIHENPNINYHFISEIERNNILIKNLSKRKFLKLDDKSIFKILSFGIDSYMPLINSDIHIKNKINKSLNNIFEKVISNFKLKYKDYIEVTHHKFEQNKIKTYYNNSSYILDLILNCRIISKKVEESLEISCNYSSNNKNFDCLWKIDIQEKSKINKWISTEINMMKNAHKTISYTSQVSSFSYNDEIQIQINIFNNNNIVDPDSIEWCEPNVSFASPQVYETTKFINNINYDELRACEVEKQILLWHDKVGSGQIPICNEVKDIFKNYFKFENIFYDKSRFCFYKFVMVPYKLGFVLKNKYCSFDINIIDLNSPIKNEVQCIYFMNTNNYTNKMDIRIGSILTLYIIDMQVNN